MPRCGTLLQRLLASALDRGRQCENSTGMSAWSNRVLVTPPNTDSRMRRCPYPPTTSNAAPCSRAWRNRVDPVESSQARGFHHVHPQAVSRQVRGDVRARQLGHAAGHRPWARRRTTWTVFIRCSSGCASCSARVASRVGFHPITAVSPACAAGCAGTISNGRPDCSSRSEK